MYNSYNNLMSTHLAWFNSQSTINRQPFNTTVRSALDAHLALVYNKASSSLKPYVSIMRTVLGQSLGIPYYSFLDKYINYVHPLSIGIVGPSCVDYGYVARFYADVDGGYPPYKNYYWEQKICSSTDPVPMSTEGGTVIMGGESNSDAQLNGPPTCTWVSAGYGHNTERVSVNSTADYYLRVRATDAAGVTKMSREKFVNVENVCYPGGANTVSVTDSPLAEGNLLRANLPDDYELTGNFPNPFSSQTDIRFALPEAGRVQLVIFDMPGREVHRLVDEELSAGRHIVPFRAGDLPSGTYLLRMTAGSFTKTEQMVLAK